MAAGLAGRNVDWSPPQQHRVPRDRQAPRGMDAENAAGGMAGQNGGRYRGLEVAQQGLCDMDE